MSRLLVWLGRSMAAMGLLLLACSGHDDWLSQVWGANAYVNEPCKAVGAAVCGNKCTNWTVCAPWSGGADCLAGNASGSCGCAACAGKTILATGPILQGSFGTCQNNFWNDPWGVMWCRFCPSDFVWTCGISNCYDVAPGPLQGANCPNKPPVCTCTWTTTGGCWR